MEMKIDLMTEKDKEIMFDFPTKMSWNPGKDVLNVLDLHNNESILLGRNDKGELIATISCLRFGDYGWIGLYIVKEEYRGKGLGKKKSEIEYYKKIKTRIQ